MSWSLQLRHGDLTLSGATFGTVTNENKLVQDLRCALLEKMGTDDLHPEFGSLIDGGTRPDGTVVPGVIGEIDLDLVVLAVESEIRRIARTHQVRQLDRAKADRHTYGKATLSPHEVLLSLVSIDVIQMQDALNISVAVQTGTGTVLTLNLPLSTSTGSAV